MRGVIHRRRGVRIGVGSLVAWASVWGCHGNGVRERTVIKPIPLPRSMDQERPARRVDAAQPSLAASESSEEEDGSSSGKSDRALALPARGGEGVPASPKPRARYEVTWIHPPDGGVCAAHAVSGAGVVVGRWEAASGDVIGFIWSDGDLQPLLPASDDTHSEAYAVDEAGRVVGRSYTPGRASRAVVWEEGRPVVLECLGGRATAYDINRLGWIVGDSEVIDPNLFYSDVPRHAFLRRDDQAGDIGKWLKDPTSVACAVNDVGTVVGYSDCHCQKTPGTRAFVWTEESIVADLGSFGGPNTRAWDVNNLDQVVGESEILLIRGEGFEYASRAFLWEGGRMTPLPTLDDRAAGARAINEAGQIVGWIETDEGFRACLWEDGLIFDLNDWVVREATETLRKARGVNDHGWIVGEGRVGGQDAAYLLTPIS